MLVNVDLYLKILSTYYLHLNCREFPKEAKELEMNKKKPRKSWETKAEKVMLTHEGHKAQDMRGIYGTTAQEVQEHIEHKAHDA